MALPAWWGEGLEWQAVSQGTDISMMCVTGNRTWKEVEDEEDWVSVWVDLTWRFRSGGERMRCRTSR